MSSYWSVVAPIIAILNSVIAVYASQFKPEAQPIRIALLIAAILLGTLAAGATIFAQYQTNARAEADRARREGIRESLANYIVSANSILTRLRDPDDVSVFDDAEAWYQEVQKYLQVSLGSSYVARFNDNSSLPSTLPTGISDQRRINFWTGVNNRDARLVQFSAEFPP